MKGVMTVTSEPPKRARLKLPSWLWGGNPRQMLAECRYYSWPDGAGSLVQPEERYLRQNADLVRVRTLAGPSVATPRFQDLANVDERIARPMPPFIENALDRRRAAAESGDLLEIVNFERLATYATPIADLPSQAQHVVDALRGMAEEGDDQAFPFSNAGLQILEVDRALVHRLKLASVWVRVRHDEKLGKGDLSHIRRTEDQEQAFSSSSGLYDGVFTMDAYMAPLLAALTPRVWAFNVVRTFGMLIFDFGRSVSGSSGDAAELLQVISTPGANKWAPAPVLAEGAAESATNWWVGSLNQMFAVLSDLAVFTDQAGAYRPDKHLEALLTIEQVFRRTTSMQVAHRDSNGRQTLMFSVLDSIQQTNGWDLTRMCRLSHAEGVLASLETSMPEPARGILLPMARQAIEALREMQHGFFIARQLGADQLELQLSDGETKVLSYEEATAQYLKVLRDATHGHGGRGKAVPQTAALLAHHDGNVPHDIGLLAYLYLLDMVASPHRLRRCLYRSGK